MSLNVNSRELALAAMSNSREHLLFEGLEMSKNGELPVRMLKEVKQNLPR